MSEQDSLTRRFEEHRGHLRATAYRMLGSASEADDAVQETWLRLSRAGASGVENLGSWLSTVVSRLCLDMLRSRASRREESIESQLTGLAAIRAAEHDPEHEALLADAVGIAMLVVLDMLAPAERVAFVLHDMFDVPFEAIAPIVERTPTATRQLASRARRRVHGSEQPPVADLARQREVVDAYLAASRAGDFDRLLAVLDPDIRLRLDRVASPTGAALELRGAKAVARGAIAGAKGARFAALARVGDTLGLLVAPRGRLAVVIAFTVEGDKVVALEAISDPERLRALDLALLDA
ncbi:MAG TPA: sigma-70 family RNA polymerase sigma factor [Oscillatoriaceae cyanobacterium]